MNNSGLHEPVLLEEVINIMKEHHEVVVDATCGNGGHSLKIASSYRDSIKALYCFDKDSESMEIAKKRLSEFTFIKCINGSYTLIGDILKRENRKADFILFDLGLSMWQIKSSKRGFTFKKSENLDMRFNKDSGVPLFIELKKINPEKLSYILKIYGDVKGAKKIATYIVKERKRTVVKTTEDLTRLLRNLHVPEKEIQKVFMALRIYINDELRELTEGIIGALSVLKTNGIVAFITYHSIEDRIVKKIDTVLGMQRIKPYPIKPSYEEIQRNKAARSAKLRAFLKGENYVEETARSIFSAVVSAFPPSPYST